MILSSISQTHLLCCSTVVQCALFQVGDFRLELDQIKAACVYRQLANCVDQAIN